MYCRSLGKAWAIAGALSACAGSGATRFTSEPAPGPQSSTITRLAPNWRAKTSERTNEVKSTLLERAAVLAMPGFESRLYLIEFPPKVVGLFHTDSEQCVGYVLEGRIESALGAGRVTVTRAGEAFVGRPHEAQRVENPDPKTTLRFVIAGTFRTQEPLSSPLSGPTGFDANTDSPAPETTTPKVTAPLTEVKRTLLLHTEIADFPGLESRLYLIEFPPNAKSKDHLHTAQGIGYVIDGSFESAFGDGPSTLKRAGDGFIDTPGLPHHFRNPDSTRPLRFVVAGTYHTDEQLFLPVK